MSYRPHYSPSILSGTTTGSRDTYYTTNSSIPSSRNTSSSSSSRSSGRNSSSSSVRTSIDPVRNPRLFDFLLYAAGAKPSVSSLGKHTTEERRLRHNPHIDGGRPYVEVKERKRVNFERPVDHHEHHPSHHHHHRHGHHHHHHHGHRQDRPPVVEYLPAEPRGRRHSFSSGHGSRSASPYIVEAAPPPDETYMSGALGGAGARTPDPIWGKNRDETYGEAWARQGRR